MAELLVSALDAHVALGAASPFVWGRCDCCLWAADWVLAQTGHDPAEEFRGRYATGRGALRLLTRGGGLQAVLGRALGPAAGPGLLGPRPGDVAAVRDAAGSEGVALRVGDWWVGKAERGLVVGGLEPFAHWSVLCLR